MITPRRRQSHRKDSRLPGKPAVEEVPDLRDRQGDLESPDEDDDSDEQEPGDEPDGLRQHRLREGPMQPFIDGSPPA